MGKLTGGIICFVVSLSLGIAAVKLIYSTFEPIPDAVATPSFQESRVENEVEKVPSASRYSNCHEVDSWEPNLLNSGVGEKDIESLIDEILPTLPKKLRKDRERLREFLEREFSSKSFTPSATRDLLFRTICTDLDGRNKRKKTDR